MKESNKKLLLLHCFLQPLLLILLVSELQANNTNSSKEMLKQELCVAKGVSPTSQHCADLIKQSQLGTVKLSPQIRATDIKKDHGINLIEFYPFVGGSAGGKVE